MNLSNMRIVQYMTVQPTYLIEALLSLSSHSVLAVDIHRVPVNRYAGRDGRAKRTDELRESDGLVVAIED